MKKLSMACAIAYAATAGYAVNIDPPAAPRTGTGSEGVMWDVVAPDNASVLRYIKKNAGKFVSETPVGLSMSVRAHLTRIDLSSARYDGAAQQLTIDIPVSWFIFGESCRSAGSYVGQNAFGAKARVSVRDCEQGSVDTDFPHIRLKGNLAMSPSVYRSIAANGMDVEVDFVSKTNSDGQVARRHPMHEEASVDSPLERRIMSYEIFGDVRAVKVLLPGAEPLTVFSK